MKITKELPKTEGEFIAIWEDEEGGLHSDTWKIDSQGTLREWDPNFGWGVICFEWSGYSKIDFTFVIKD